MFRLVCFLSILGLLLFGCKSDEGGSLPIQPNHEPEPTYFSFQGRVVAGVIYGAQVTLYPILEGSRADAPIASTETGASGFFGFTEIPDQYRGLPAVIEVAIDGAQIVCDSVRGCGDYRFGQSFVVDAPEFILRASIPKLEADGVYNSTLLTHVGHVLASHLVEQAPAGALNDEDVSRHFSNANAQVSRRFGVIGDLLSFAPTDLTSEAELREGESSDLYYSATNAALGESLRASTSGLGLWHSLDEFAVEFAQNGLAGHSGMDNDGVTKELLLGRISDIYNYLQAELGLDYTSALSELAVQRGLVLSEPFDRYTQSSGEIGLAAPIEKAKTLVQDIRQIASSMNLSQLVTLTDMSALFSGNPSEIFEGFGVALDTSELLEGERLAPIITAAQAVAMTVLEALRSQLQEGFVPARINGIGVQHELVSGKHVITVVDVVDVCDKHAAPCFVQSDIQFVFDIGTFGGNVEDSLLILTGTRTEISGGFFSAGYSVQVPGNGSEIMINRLAMTLGQGEETGKTLIDIDNLYAEVPLQLVSTVDSQQTSIDGVLSAALEKLQTIFFTDDEVINTEENKVEVISTSVFELYQLKCLDLTLSGLVDLGQEDEFFAAFNLLQNVQGFSGLAEYRTREVRICDQWIESCEDQEPESELIGETEENFIGISASIGFKAHLQGVREPAVVTISGSRESATDNVLNNMTVIYPGHAFRLNGRFSSRGDVLFLDARNQDGIHLYVDANSSGRRSGTITTQVGESLADIVDMGQWLQIRYHDGAFQSL